MNIELLAPEEVIGFVKWTTANLRDDKKLPSTYSITRTVEVWNGRTSQVEVDLTPDEVLQLHVELGFARASDSDNITL